ncbi:MAG: GDYXXLXY domain-containing protein [Endomicrobium sp.]|jgi:uncharacterized membrane-anchored protein|nr:GDYXXLXY domain-containing protein [Endomicrobium sp.]
MDRKKAFFILMALWFCLIAFYTGYKEYNLKFGRSVMLRVIPVDPRDLFRGDYIELDYEISRIKAGQRIIAPYGGYLEEQMLRDGQTIYVELIKDGKYYKSGNLYLDRPKNGLFIKGKIERGFSGFSQSDFTIIYGIENYFLPEDAGREIELERDMNKVTAEITINSYGNASIKHIYINDKKAEFKKQS